MSDAGSSPLARGLPDRQETHETKLRIIPARAGFTFLRGKANPATKDHPRSRGVYWGDRTKRITLDGSSPLARGLLGFEQHACVLHRIIPARAGFTRSAPPRSYRRKDHPRSRGVYFIGSARRSRSTGSSPLARGLPAERNEIVGKRGIIPARAGFTRTSTR